MVVTTYEYIMKDKSVLSKVNSPTPCFHCLRIYWSFCLFVGEVATHGDRRRSPYEEPSLQTDPSDKLLLHNFPPSAADRNPATGIDTQRIVNGYRMGALLRPYRFVFDAQSTSHQSRVGCQLWQPSDFWSPWIPMQQLWYLISSI